jgi:CheY-like chemotaxis protein
VKQHAGKAPKEEPAKAPAAASKVKAAGKPGKEKRKAAEPSPEAEKEKIQLTPAEKDYVEPPVDGETPVAIAGEGKPKKVKSSGKTPSKADLTPSEELFQQRDNHFSTVSDDTAESALRKALPIRKGKRILIADDDEDAREFIGHYIAELGAEFAECASPRDLPEKIRGFKPDLITLDIVMPDANGWDVLAALKRTEEFSHIPVVIISMIPNRKKAISLGAVDALSKPINQREFAPCVKQVLNTEEIAGRNILIVDDDPHFQELLKAWLDESKNEIRAAADGQAGMDILKGGFSPDAILLDLMMPVMDGLEFLKSLRSQAEWMRTPVIVMTGKKLSFAEREFIERRAESIIMKGDRFLD